MDLEVFLNKNQFLERVNKNLSVSPHLILKRIRLNDLLSVRAISNTAQLVIKVKWSFLLLPFVKGISIVKISLENGDIPKVFWKGKQVKIKGWTTIFNDLIDNVIKKISYQYPNIWPKLNDLKIGIAPIQVHKESLVVPLEVCGMVELEFNPDGIPISPPNKVEFQILNPSCNSFGPIIIDLIINNNTLRVISQKIRLDQTTYLGFSLGVVLLKLEEGELHIITQIKQPFKGYVKTSCGMVLEANSGKLILKDVRSRLESNNILAQMGHLSFKKSLNQLLVIRLEEIINLKIKEEVIHQMKKFGQLTGVTFRYQKVKILENVLNLEVSFEGKITLYPLT